jgi:hypothetical protein
MQAGPRAGIGVQNEPTLLLFSGSFSTPFPVRAPLRGAAESVSGLGSADFARSAFDVSVTP